MRRIVQLFFFALGVSAHTFVAPAVADTFGGGVNAFDIEFVTIGDPGNLPDVNPNPAGAVNYSYRIGKYEISEQMIDKADAENGLGITKDTRGPDKPATSVTWYEAAKFVNWLNTSTGSTPAYKFDGSGNFQLWSPSDPGYDSTNLYRNSLARYFLPSQHEWHKAAYYNASSSDYFTYPTGSDSVPDGIDYPGDPVFDALFYDGGLNSDPNIVTDVGLLGPYGTAGQGGNVDEWLETTGDWDNNSTSEQRIRAGGAWGDGPNLLAAWNPSTAAPFVERPYSGFRVASDVPEPNSVLILVTGTIGLLALRFRL